MYNLECEDHSDCRLLWQTFWTGKFLQELFSMENSCKNFINFLSFSFSSQNMSFLVSKKPDKVTIPMKYIFFSRVFLQPMQWFLAISYCNESLEEQGISCAAPYAMAAAMFSVKALVQSYGITHFQTGSPWPPFAMFRLGRKKCKSMVFYQPLFWGLKKG